MRGMEKIPVVALALVVLVAATTSAQVGNLRITEVDPAGDRAEVSNLGPGFTTAQDHPFCHRFNYLSVIPNGTNFGPGSSLVFLVSNLRDDDSDLWLYVQPPFPIGANIVHGLKYGPAPNIGRTGLAASVGLWPSANAFAPAPPAGMSLAWDGFGFDPLDWFVDETPNFGGPNSTPPGTVPNALGFPSGLQDFENVPLGDEVFAITDWVVVDQSAPGVFTVRSVGDVLGVPGPRPGSKSNRWLRIRDQDAADVQNRFYSAPVVFPVETGYRWTFFLNIERLPQDDQSSTPRLVIQHRDTGGFANAWGIEVTRTSVNLVVTGIGGTPQGARIYQIGPGMDVGDWVRIDLFVDFAGGDVRATANQGAPAILPIDLAPTADKKDFRFCYRGEGLGNEATLLLDDLSVEVLNPVEVCGTGAVNAGCGPIEDVLFANGQTGGSGRFLTIDPGASLSMTIQEPSGNNGDGRDTKAVVYVWLGTPRAGDVLNLPRQLGRMCFGPFILATKNPKKIWNGIGIDNKLGTHTGPGDPPVIPDSGSFEFLSLPNGVGQMVTVTFQGILEDSCTQGTVPFSVTNGFVIAFETE